MVTLDASWKCSASANMKNNNKININVRIRPESCYNLRKKLTWRWVMCGTELGWVDWFRVKTLLDLMTAEIQKLFFEWEGPVDLTIKSILQAKCLLLFIAEKFLFRKNVAKTFVQLYLLWNSIIQPTNRRVRRSSSSLLAPRKSLKHSLNSPAEARYVGLKKMLRNLSNSSSPINVCRIVMPNE